MTGRSITTSSWLMLQTVNEVYIIKWAISFLLQKALSPEYNIQYFWNVRKKCRYIFDYLAGLRRENKKNNILLPNLKGIWTWSNIKRDKSVRGDCVSSWIALCETKHHQHPLTSNPISPRWWILLFIFDFIKCAIQQTLR